MMWHFKKKLGDMIGATVPTMCFYWYCEKLAHSGMYYIDNDNVMGHTNLSS